MTIDNRGTDAAAHAGHAKCPFCRCCVSTEEHGPFRDAVSFREFQISGICQKCQDEVFNPEEGE